ncbi:MAG: VPLPA-CTERM sorting domain-containing protein [Alphaproteobacteria bacterium]
MRILSFIASLLLTITLTTPAHASIIYLLDVISSPSIGSGTLGTVMLTQNGVNQVDVKVTLAANTAFVSTGGPHHAFTFNLNLLTPYTVSITSPLSGFTLSGPNPTNTPYGVFTNGIDCPGCGPGASNAKPGPLEFSVMDSSGVSISNFVANLLKDGSTGYFFSADVIGPAGSTGNIAAIRTGGGGPLSTVPLPAALPLFGGSLLALAYAARRKKAAANA